MGPTNVQVLIPCWCKSFRVLIRSWIVERRARIFSLISSRSVVIVIPNINFLNCLIRSTSRNTSAIWSKWKPTFDSAAKLQDSHGELILPFQRLIRIGYRAQDSPAFITMPHAPCFGSESKNCTGLKCTFSPFSSFSNNRGCWFSHPQNCPWLCMIAESHHKISNTIATAVRATTIGIECEIDPFNSGRCQGWLTVIS